MLRHRVTAVVVPLTLSLGVLASAAGAQSTSTTPSTTPSAPSTSTSASSPSTTVATALTVKIRVNAGDADVKRRLATTERASTTESLGTAWSLISTDTNLSEFASLVTATKTQALFSSVDQSTFLIPTNAAFSVLDPVQRARLNDSKFLAQAVDLVRNTVAKGRVPLADLLPQSVTFPAALNVRPRTVVTPPLVSRITTDGGSTVQVRVSSLDSVTPARARVFVGDAFVDLADANVSNGVLHTVDTVSVPARSGRTLTDLVGR
jgi:uncharacterized surface protein with fasciclin (FAS1) repeats